MQTESGVFISYTSPDKDFARLLSLDLHKEGLRVWFDEWEMKPGDSLRERLGRAITQASYLVVILSPDSVRSKWVKLELNAALARELELKSVFIIPVLYRRCTVPPFLKDKVFADFTSDRSHGLRQLLKRLKPDHLPPDPSFAFGTLDNGLVEDKTKAILNSLASKLRTYVSLVTVDARRVASEEGPKSEYYRLLSMSKDPSMHPAFREWQAFRLVADREASMLYECASATHDLCMPIFAPKEHGGALIAVFFTGQFVARDVDDSVLRRLRRQEKADGLPKDALVKAHKKLEVLEKPDIDRAFRLLSRAAKRLGPILSPEIPTRGRVQKKASRQGKRKRGSSRRTSKKNKMLPTTASSRRRRRRSLR